jgi:hypothetical protein
MGNLIPNEVLIYERENGTIYARYQDRPEIDRWVIGLLEPTFNYSNWKHLNELAKTDKVLKTQLDKLINLYYLTKNENHNDKTNS